MRWLKNIDLGGLFLYFSLSVFALVMLMPLVYMASTAFKPIQELFLFPPRFWVMQPTLDNFYDLLKAADSSIVPFTRYFFNSVVVTGGIVGVGVAIASMAAYPLSKHDFYTRKTIFSLIIMGLMFAPQVTQIPQYIVVSRIGIMDSYFALIIPYLAAPIGLFLMKQFLDQIPDALLEAARIDGANEWTTYWRIILPLLKPAITTMALFSFMTAWNDPWAASVFTSSEDMKTLPFAIQTISGGSNVIARTGTLGAASFLMIIPSLLVFIVTQRMALQTMAHSGLKE